jgi:hypothetical protein
MDEFSPLPIPVQARDPLVVMPEIAELCGKAYRLKPSRNAVQLLFVQKVLSFFEGNGRSLAGLRESSGR